MGLKHAEITGPLIDLFFDVYRALGHGFLETVYSNAMVVAGQKLGLEIRQEQKVQVVFQGKIIGKYKPDLIVNGALIAELKTASALVPGHYAQLLHYLKSTKYEVGFLFNFGPQPQYKRMIFENSRKGSLSWLTADKR